MLTFDEARRIAVNVAKLPTTFDEARRIAVNSFEHALSRSYNKVGDVLVAQGDLAAALKAYRDASA